MAVFTEKKKDFSLKLKIWRQKDKDSKGHYENFVLNEVNEEMSFLEMLDVLNEQLVRSGKEVIAFDHDCREGICGSCSLTINGQAHGPERGTTVCQLHMRKFHDGQELVIEPWRAKAFPVIKDLIVDRSAFDRIVQAGAYVSVKTGSAPDANAIPIPKEDSDFAFNAAACIGCGACVAACKNSSAMLFSAAKVAQYAKLPQGQVEKKSRVIEINRTMDDEGFGHCTNEGECQAACPKDVSLENIALFNRELIKASLS